jgi:replication factor A1
MHPILFCLLSQGSMVQITVPKKLEKDFRTQLSQDRVYLFVGVSAVDITKKTYIYHYQKYMLQFTSRTKVHRLESRGADIPHFSFNFCPFDELPTKNIPSKPLLGIFSVCFTLLRVVL